MRSTQIDRMRVALVMLALIMGTPAVAQVLQTPTTRYVFRFDHPGDAARYEIRYRPTEAWQSIGTARAVRLPPLVPGTYSVQVRACNVADACTEPATLGVTVENPPPPPPPLPALPTNLRIELAPEEPETPGEPNDPGDPGDPEEPNAPVLFRANYADFPNAGFGGAEAEALGQRFTREFLPTGGPDGRPAHRLAMRYCAGCSDNGGQFNWGNRGNVVSSDAANGERRYYRFRMRLSGNHRGRPWGGGSGPSSLQNKLLVVGQGCGSNCRFILSYQTDSNGIRNFRLQKDGGADVADSGSYPNGQWLNVQVELHTTNNSTGGYKLWVNNANYSQPTAQRTGIAFTGANHRYVWLGGFMNDGIMQDGTHVLDLADFEIGTTFDPQW